MVGGELLVWCLCDGWISRFIGEFLWFWFERYENACIVSIGVFVWLPPRLLWTICFLLWFIFSWFVLVGLWIQLNFSPITSNSSFLPFYWFGSRLERSSNWPYRHPILSSSTYTFFSNVSFSISILKASLFITSSGSCTRINLRLPPSFCLTKNSMR